ncbi:hypothetical protein COU89_03455 [Candidatus Roizmanbacteria bacterium CG10_big_fil_rev_8_21_14_0_10_45_7]|uniref:Peptidase S8/S53 domain-containing protein n=1 Tax=Candidatus Roizmanbacteria bacterium CG10_big_fil_rev_8_21_14_0_10_45_7 TaxID=1974854 RepID=A0A2M8KU58_9BACT|nr:MAG: hypothetical protein COU89_03455 [Candidatus Roizmanbacteria bacterium CG10_big_fil_rev_8_21_14_0_10_45_7]
MRETYSRLLRSAAVVGLVLATLGQPNDPLYPDQWNLAPTAQEGTGWIPVVVAVLDGGINPHPDLPESSLWTNPNELPNNRVDDDSNGYVDDAHGCSFLPKQPQGCADLSDNSFAQHGMTVTGVMAQESNNAIGAAGSLPNIPIQYLPIRIMQKEGFVNYSDIVEGLQYVHTLMEQGVPIRVVNMSFSGFNTVNNLPQGDGLLSLLNDEGVVLAPGEDIETVCYGNAPDYPADQCRPSGTSMAAPHVSQLAALIASTRPELSPDEIKAIIRETAYEGKIDMMAALRETLDLQQTFMPLMIK